MTRRQISQLYLLLFSSFRGGLLQVTTTTNVLMAMVDRTELAQVYLRYAGKSGHDRFREKSYPGVSLVGSYKSSACAGSPKVILTIPTFLLSGKICWIEADEVCKRANFVLLQKVQYAMLIEFMIMSSLKI